MADNVVKRPPQVLKIALIQMCPQTLEPERNYDTASRHIIKAATQGASLAVLPEYHLTGWAPEDPRFKAIAATALDYVFRYQDLARQHKINIVPGTIVGQETSTSTKNASLPAMQDTDHLLNRTYFISSSGEILGSYTKVNLWHPEREHLTSAPDYALAAGASSNFCRPTASHHDVLQTPIGPVGLLICYDLAFPEASRALVRGGARIIIIPTFTKTDDPSPMVRAYNPAGEALFTQATLLSRACENTCAVVFVNPGGRVDEGYMGLSQVVMPIVGTVEGSFTDSEEGCRIVDVDLAVLDVAEENYKIRHDLAREGFHYY